jgi:hypothetical protein
MRWKSIAVAVAAWAAAAPAWSQAGPNGVLAGGPEPRRSALALHVAGGAGQPIAVSLGLVERSATGAMMRQRREMQADCTWRQVSDIALAADDAMPLQNPSRLGGAERFGAYYARVFAALATSKGAAASAAQQGCVRQTMTRVAEGLLSRRRSGPGSAAGPLPEE